MADADIGGGAKIVDSLFVDNTTDNQSCVVEFNTGGDDGTTGTFTMVNNTIVNNDSGGVCVQNSTGSAYAGNGSLFAYDNIIYNNAGGDIYTDHSTGR